jgi:hypothetical protein
MNPAIFGGSEQPVAAGNPAEALVPEAYGGSKARFPNQD